MLASLAAACSQCSYEVRFVNNGTDESEAFVMREFANVRVLPTRGNIGFAAANNYLANEARGDWLLLANPDTRLFPGSVDALIQAARENPEFAVFGGLTVDQNGAPVAESSFSFPTPWTLLRELFGVKLTPEPVRRADGICEVDAVSGGFMLVARGSWESLDGFDETYFLYAEELDFCKRLHDQGGRIASVSTAHIYHDVGGGDRYSPSRMEFSMLGRATYYYKHFSWLKARSCIMLNWIGCLVRLANARLRAPYSQRHAGIVRAFSTICLKPWTWMKGYKA